MKSHNAQKWTAALTVVALLVAQAPARAEEAAVPAETAEKPAYFHNFLADGGAVFATPFRKENRKLSLGIVAGIGATMLLFDDPIQNDFYPNRHEETPTEYREWGDMMEFAGIAYGSVLGLHGVLFDNPAHRREAALAFETYVWAAAALGSLKWVAGRERPEQTGDPFIWKPKDHASSFPSGHTTQAFAAATLISEHYDNLWVTIPAYTAATTVGVSRSLANKHWASDVIAGAALGTYIAHILRKRHRERSPGNAWRLEPDLDGVRLVHSF